MTQRTPLLALILLACSVQVLQAADIRLKNKAKLQGDVARVDDDYVFVRLPRQAIATIDGEVLPQPLSEGVPAPAFSVVDITGATQTIAKDQGHVTVLHFWVHWCPHCRSDAPQIQALHDQYANDPRVRIVTVSLDEARPQLDAFLAQQQIGYPVISAAEQAGAPEGANLPLLYQVNGFPVTYVIDAQGVIRHKIIGSFVETRKDVGALIAELLPKEPAPAPSS